MQNLKEDVRAGQAFYTKRNLLLYDVGVLGLSNSWIWRCPTHKLLKMFNDNITANHLDVGVGTGYYLDHCQFPKFPLRLALMDLNGEALTFASTRVRRYKPKTYVRNVLEPIPFEDPCFDSVSVNYLLHCVPGTTKTKAVIFDHLKALMNPGAICFGSTLLQGGVARSWGARQLMSFYNDRGIFANTADDLSEFEDEFRQRFERVEFKVLGCAVLFKGYKS